MLTRILLKFHACVIKRCFHIHYQMTINMGCCLYTRCAFMFHNNFYHVLFIYVIFIPPCANLCHLYDYCIHGAILVAIRQIRTHKNYRFVGRIKQFTHKMASLYSTAIKSTLAVTGSHGPFSNLCSDGNILSCFLKINSAWQVFLNHS